MLLSEERCVTDVHIDVDNSVDHFYVNCTQLLSWIRLLLARGTQKKRNQNTDLSTLRFQAT